VATGQIAAVEGLFRYMDGREMKLIGGNILVHGTIV
jgi:hypothetical protein